MPSRQESQKTFVPTASLPHFKQYISQPPVLKTAKQAKPRPNTAAYDKVTHIVQHFFLFVKGKEEIFQQKQNYEITIDNQATV
jgi:hypothetical protein